MLREVLLLVSTAAATYAWLCVVSAPLIGAVRSIVRRLDKDAWGALALAAAGAALWTAVAAALVVLAMTLEPGAGLALLRGQALWPGLLLGGVMWGFQLALTWHLPRVGPDFEAATALAIVSLVRDDQPTLARVERWYVEYAIAPADDGAVSLVVQRRGLSAARRAAGG